jgi:hypothetical protein
MHMSDSVAILASETYMVNAMAVRSVLEALGLQVDLHVVNRRDRLEAFVQEHRTCAALILAAHGHAGRGITYPVVTEQNGVIGREDVFIESLRIGAIADPGLAPFVLSTSCSTEHERVASAFAGSGYRHLLAHGGYNQIDSMLCYVTVLFTSLLAEDRDDERAVHSLAEAHALARAVQPFAYGTRGYRMTPIPR